MTAVGSTAWVCQWVATACTVRVKSVPAAEGVIAHVLMNTAKQPYIHARFETDTDNEARHTQFDSLDICAHVCWTCMYCHTVPGTLASSMCCTEKATEA